MHIDLLRKAAQFEEKCQDPGKLPSPFLAHDSLISCWNLIVNDAIKKIGNYIDAGNWHVNINIGKMSKFPQKWAHLHRILLNLFLKQSIFCCRQRDGPFGNLIRAQDIKIVFNNFY